MKLRFKYTDKIVGLFLLISLAFLIGAIFLIIYNNKMFTKKYHYYSQFDNANGLKINQNIFFKGFKIGRVTKISLNTNNLVDISFFVYKNYIDKITVNSVLNKASNPITGSRIVFIPNSIETEIAPEKSMIYSLDTKEGKLLLANGEVKKKADAISNIIASISDLLNSLNSDRNADDNSIARILVNAADSVEKINKELLTVDKILKNIKFLSYQMKSPDGLVKRLIDPSGEFMFNSIQISLDQLSSMMKDLHKFSTFAVGQTDQIESLILDSQTTIDNVNDVLEGIKNNPLIKGGITEKKDQETIKQTVRDRDF